jgi:dTDP-4-dehydrorhamnose 3,5-epimerase
MEVIETPLPGVLVIKPRIFRDERGWFVESWRRERYDAMGIPGEFVQDNVAASQKGVLRGLHYQWPNPQGKLVMVLQGEVFDVAVDIRSGSPHFGRWYGTRLSSDNGHQLWIPEGFAHGYAVLSETAVFAYKCTRAYDPAADAGLRYSDPQLGVNWPLSDPLVSSKDANAPVLSAVESSRLPRFGTD